MILIIENVDGQKYMDHKFTLLLGLFVVKVGYQYRKYDNGRWMATI